MQTKLIAGLALAGIVVVGGGAYYMTSSNFSNGPVTEVDLPTPVQGTSTEPVAVENTAPETGTGTLLDLFAKAGNLHCTFSHDEKGNEVKGDVYISGGLLRADIIAKIAVLGDKAIEAHSVQKDGFAYGWTNVAPQGTKIKIPAGKSIADVSGKSGVNATSVNYSCENKTSDASIFAIPSDVQFVEVTSAQ